MAKYVTHEKEVYDTVRAKPFTKIPSKPTWAHKEILLEEASHITLDYIVSYDWAYVYGLPAEIEGATQYLTTTGNTCAIATKPDDIDPDIIVNRTTHARVKVLQARTIVKKRDLAVVLGFRKGVSNIFWECL